MGEGKISNSFKNYNFYKNTHLTWWEVLVGIFDGGGPSRNLDLISYD